MHGHFLLGNLRIMHGHFLAFLHNAWPFLTQQSSHKSGNAEMEKRVGMQKWEKKKEMGKKNGHLELRTYEGRELRLAVYLNKRAWAAC